MNSEPFLVNYLSKYMTLSEEEVEIIRNENIIRQLKKNDFLLKEGQIAQECFLVLKGCIKRYYLEDGIEKIMEFYTENDPIAPASYVNKEPSKYFLSCIEPCVISAGTVERTQQFLQRFPRFVPIFIKMGENLSAARQTSMDDFKNLSPEMRYQKLLESRPELLNRVPQYMIASYLGIQPETLSRIRKRMWSNNKK